MIEPRIYRAALLPALLFLIVAMFSLESRPAPAPQGLAADVLFEGGLAVGLLRDVERRFPDRRPGSAGDEAAANLVATQLARRRFGTVVRDRFRAEGRRLVNVVATRPGATRDRIVVMAARDTGPGPDATGSAADTAALLELARVFEGRSTRRTLVLASVDGSTLGNAGARRFLETAEDRERIRAIVVVSNLAASTSRGPLVVAWSNDATRGNIALNRTAVASLREELGGVPSDEGPFGQLARLAFPIAIGAQGSLLAEGADAVRISGSGELPPRRAGVDAVDVERYGDLGRGALRTVTALDQGGRLEHGPPAYVVAFRKVIPRWSIALLVAALLVPALVATVDAFARASRRRTADGTREHVGRWWAWALAAAVPFLAAYAVAELIVLAGGAPDAPPAAFPPTLEPVDPGDVVVLLGVAATAALAWVLLRPLATAWLLTLRAPGGRDGRRGARGRRRRLDPGSPGAGAVVAFALALVAAAVWVANPFAALALVPAAHLWMLALLTNVRRPLAALLVLGGLLPPAAIALYYLARLALDPLEGAWYLFLLVTGGHVGVLSVLAGCVLLGLLGCTVAAVAARRGEDEDARPAARPVQRVRGPGGYAGPGSLGGTDSALRR